MKSGNDTATYQEDKKLDFSLDIVISNLESVESQRA